MWEGRSKKRNDPIATNSRIAVSSSLNQGFDQNFTEYVITLRDNEFKEHIVLEETKPLLQWLWLTVVVLPKLQSSTRSSTK